MEIGETVKFSHSPKTWTVTDKFKSFIIISDGLADRAVYKEFWNELIRVPAKPEQLTALQVAQRIWDKSRK